MKQEAATPPRPAARPWGWWVFLIVALSGAFGHLALQDDSLRGGLYTSVGLLCVGAAVWGIRKNGAVPAPAWTALALSMASAISGDMVWAVNEILGAEPPFPGPQDVMYVFSYIFQFYALIVMTRRSGGRDRESLLDALTVSIALALITWVFYISEITGSGFGPDLVSAAYPLLDLALLGLLLRLMLSLRTFTPSLLLVAGAVLSNLIGDVSYLVLRVSSDFSAGGTLDVLWLIAYVLFATASLHPSARSLPVVPRSRQSLPRTRVALTMASALTGPFLIVHQHFTGHVDVVLMTSATGLLFLLVVLRLNQVTLTLGRAVDEEAQKFEALIRNATDAITIIDRDGTIRYASPSIRRIWDRRPDELVGRSMSELVAPEDADALAAQLKDLIQSKAPLSFLVRAQRSDGDQRWLEITGHDLSDDPVIEGIVLNQRDVTARKEAEEELHRKEETFRTVVEKVPAVVYMAEADDGDFLYVSPQLQTILGYTPEEWMGDSGLWYRGLHPEDRARALEDEKLSWSQATAGQRYQSEYRFHTKDGRVVWLSDEWSVIIGDDGEPSFFSGVLLDITDSRHLEDQMRQKQKMEAIGRLAGGVAHDFNNLLSVIQNCARFAAEEIDKDHPAQQDLTEVMDAGNRAGRLTKQLLAFSRQETVRPEVLDLNDTLDSLEGLLRRTVKESIDLKVRTSAEPYLTLCDPGQIEQVVMNLVVNAQDAMPRGGSLTIRTEAVDVDADRAALNPGMQPGSYIKLSVTDTGTGMSKETRDRIFEPFFTTKVRGSGTGLGLATVYGIVKRLNGYILVDSVVGDGTTFDVYLQPTEADELEDRLPQVAPERSEGQGTILVVEDETAVRRVVTRLLGKRGFDVLEASLGSEALEVYEREGHRIDLVLTDVVMPRMSGPELAERLHSLTPDLKVVYMSGYTDDAVAAEGLLTQDDPVLIHKPFDPNELVETLQASLSAS